MPKIKVFSSNIDQNARTPQGLLKYINTRFGKLQDVAPPNHKKNSLADDFRWPNKCFVNPPYNNIGKWLAKAVREKKKHNSNTLFLVPFRPYRKYFLDAVDHITFVEVFTSGIAFSGYKRPLPHVMSFISIGLKPIKRRSRSIISCPRFYILDTKEKLTFADVQRRMKTDFDLKRNVDMLKSIKIIPESDFFVPLTLNSIPKIFMKSVKHTVVVTPILYKDDRKSKYFFGSYGIIDSSKSPPPETYFRIKLYFNSEFVQKK